MIADFESSWRLAGKIYSKILPCPLSTNENSRFLFKFGLLSNFFVHFCYKQMRIFVVFAQDNLYLEENKTWIP